ncbi:saccharopine dehydrogenase NADP-binding domain-containing protein [Streptomyces sp. ST2-7A]|uniref:saccharopine dehydrogenase NADP-binding domain-containing protein n=1 Tax=Streptomyces sp. ST2-7A TaxID=2907214 RepID=UPI001F38AC88|nr:saccharopine dehydrogenase NADP-binding domain-containing protein [Streptomyces sp. ST2-7A]MCE7079270.1 saccharopine dehydrogenase NADP-binding domain-containing protein [Streptomyces sp. ST2-7A]
MRRESAIGVLGGYGAVGAAVVRRLLAAGAGPILVAGRDPARAREPARRTGANDAEVEVLRTDLDDPDSLGAFADRCRLVVNCAGPSYRVLDTVARAALRAGADYVDAAGDDPAAARLRDVGEEHAGREDGRILVLSAGALPGLSGLIPRVLVARAERPVRLDAHLGGVAPLTPAAAGDVLLSHGPEHGVPSAAWRGGEVCERVLPPLRGIGLEAFPRPVGAFPFLSTEAVRLARATGLEEVNWYTVFGGERLAEELALTRALEGTDTAPLIAAAAEDVARLGSWYGQEFRLWEGPAEGSPSRSAVLRAEDSYELSAFLAAEAALRVLEGSVRPGVSFAADVLDPEATVRALAADGCAELTLT